MEIVFIRHGQGEHTLNVPKTLHISDPSLTNEGIIQATALKKELSLTGKDVILSSPTQRTLQTASILCEDIPVRKLVSPLVAPRMFPQLPEEKTLPCDEILSKEEAVGRFPDFYLHESLRGDLWELGINTMPPKKFKVLAEEFLKACEQLTINNRIHIVSHDGTITSIREVITGRTLTREDFPKETGWLSVIV
ncbi:histidine phosphatase family protein [Halobacillus kuroshimensis]|uniref:Histidine phosphatase family protein n=1 Tax=Halobacillus kuroshimensis TaxID=302481 RepID=A0ABS3DRY1_9BACI|nr:histidine phosphatase family protein [Halobacillus kuroshimensis]MBN8234052.1 histidine phosphatase family protein [Halobacillus kuroshimensis]